MRGAVRPRIRDIERFAKLYALGCVVSRTFFNRWEPAEIHHLVEGSRRLGHQFTIPLFPWFHRGVPPQFEMRPSECEEKLGPSLARSKRAFVEKFGTERELLSKTNELIAEIEIP
jgi:Recombination enhancement, RecA-dependent nuclease